MQNPEDDKEQEEEVGEQDAVVEDEEPTLETAEPEPKQPTNEIKVVIIMKADKVMVGVQSPDCDPVYKTMTGDLAAALEQVPALVAEAKLKWETNPRYPKADLPEPPPPTPRSQPAQTPKPKTQPSFF